MLFSSDLYRHSERRNYLLLYIKWFHIIIKLILEAVSHPLKRRLPAITELPDFFDISLDEGLSSELSPLDDMYELMKMDAEVIRYFWNEVVGIFVSDPFILILVVEEIAQAGLPQLREVRQRQLVHDDVKGSIE